MLYEVITVQIGLNDWDNSQVVSGLEGNERLVLVSAAQQRAKTRQHMPQQQFADGRFRQIDLHRNNFV